MRRPFASALLLAAAAAAMPLARPAPAQSPSDALAAPLGYYRFPAIHGETIVFTAEGDLWRVGIEGGVARRMTTHPAEEAHAAISPDGRTLAFTAEYEGPAEVYTMPIDGGVPVRRTYDGGGAQVVGWTPDGRILYTTRRYSTLPNAQLVAIDPGPRPEPGVLAQKASAVGQRRTVLPLAQAAGGSYAPDGTLFFTRFPFQGSHTRRYQGGTAQDIWKWNPDAAATPGSTSTPDRARAPARSPEAVPLTPDYPGTSRTPMWWNGRVYFASDRSGVMNLWSMDPDGGDLRQHTFHEDYEVRSPALDDGRIVYQHGADLRLLDLRTGEDRLVPIRLASDFDHLRERWVEAPMEWVTAAHLSPDGDRVVLTARGQVFVAPAGDGRIAQATRNPGVRYRAARFLPDGRSLVVLSDESGEIELWRLPANGVGAPVQLTDNGTILRWEAIPSPDGRWIAHHDKNQQLWLLEVETGEQRRIAVSAEGGFDDLAWSPDSHWLAFAEIAASSFRQIQLYDVESGTTTALTTDRYDSYAPAWSPDGDWIYFLSDRHFESLVGSPWGPRQPEPFFDRQTKIYEVALRKGLRSPFRPDDELVSGGEDVQEGSATGIGAGGAGGMGMGIGMGSATTGNGSGNRATEGSPRFHVDGDGRGSASAFTVGREDRAVAPGRWTAPAGAGPERAPIGAPARRPVPNAGPSADIAPPGKRAERPAPAGANAANRPAAISRPRPVQIDVDGLQERLVEVPVSPGNYASLTTDGERLYWLSTETGPERERTLTVLEIANDDPKPAALVADVRGYELSADGKKLLVRKGDALYVLDAGSKAPGELAEHRVDLSAWKLRLDPREEWRQMFTEAWRLERDYFYDPGMHGLDWPAIREKYRPLAERVTDRAELSDVLGQMVAELSALHIFVRGGDMREGDDDVTPASLGAVLERDEAAGGYRVVHVYRSDPDLPSERSPLARPGVDVRDGDVILAVNGVAALSAPDIGALLRDRAGEQVLLRVRAADGGAERDVVVVPITLREAGDLRYDEWEYTRRLAVDSLSDGRIGYVHLRAMGRSNIAEWARGFYPVFNREALIIDVRHNRGGNIDSWILEKLLRRAWMYWQPRVGKPYWNMQYAFRGPMVVLTNAFTASDGEAFAAGFRRLGLGKVLGTRTWGGEIWLTSSNILVDRGIATAAEFGVYGPEGEWLIEGHGVDPDIVVDNLPHAAFTGADAQLEAAVAHLLDALRRNPVTVPAAPPYPIKRGS